MPPPPAVDSQIEGESRGADRRGAKWSHGRRSIVRGLKLWKLLKEWLRDPIRPAFQSAWQDVDLVWWVLRTLLVKLDFGKMGPYWSEPSSTRGV